MIVSWQNDVAGIIERATISSSIDEVRKIGQRVEQATEIWRSWVLAHSGSVVLLDASGGTFDIPPNAVGELKNIKAQYEQKAECSVCMGVGTTLQESVTALKVAAQKSANAVVLYEKGMQAGTTEQEEKDELDSLKERALQKYDPWKESLKKNPSWVQEVQYEQPDHFTDGDITIPKMDNPKRQLYNERYKDAMFANFGAPGFRLEPKTIPVSQLDSGHFLPSDAKSRNRYKMYSIMARKDKLMPIFVGKTPDGKYKVLDGNHRLMVALEEGVPTLDAYELVSDGLHKGLKDFALAAGIGAAGAMAVLPSGNTAVEQQRAPIVETVKPFIGPPEFTGPSMPDKWSTESLAHELHPIAALESSMGANIAHTPHSKGEFHTAYGPLGMKPVTAHEEYMRQPGLKSRWPGLEDTGKFLNAFRYDPVFYNTVASAHWDGLKQKADGSLAGAAYSWRWGPGKYRQTLQSFGPKAVQNDPYVATYLNKFRDSKAFEYNSPVYKAEPNEMSSPALLGGAGNAGMTGAQRPAAPAKPVPPRAEASEHSQGEAARSLVANEAPGAPEMTHAAGDFADFLKQQASQQQQADQQEGDQVAVAAQKEKAKAEVVKILQQVKGKAGALEELKANNPEMYKVVTSTIEAMMLLARELTNEGGSERGEE